MGPNRTPHEFLLKSGHQKKNQKRWGRGRKDYDPYDKKKISWKRTPIPYGAKWPKKRRKSMI